MSFYLGINFPQHHPGGGRHWSQIPHVAGHIMKEGYERDVTHLTHHADQL